MAPRSRFREPRCCKQRDQPRLFECWLALLALARALAAHESARGSVPPIATASYACADVTRSRRFEPGRGPSALSYAADPISEGKDLYAVIIKAVTATS